MHMLLERLGKPSRTLFIWQSQSKVHRHHLIQNIWDAHAEGSRACNWHQRGLQLAHRMGAPVPWGMQQRLRQVKVKCKV